MDRSDFRSKLVRDMIPDPPDHLTTHQKGQWRMEKWEELWGPQPSQNTATLESSRVQPKAKARAAAFFGGGSQRPRRWISYRWPRFGLTWLCGPWPMAGALFGGAWLFGWRQWLFGTVCGL